MSTAFTVPTAGGYIPWRLTEANEIRLAYSERRQAIGQSAAANWTTFDKPLLYTTWRDIQTWCESYCTSFVDHSQTIAGAASVPVYTLGTFRTAAGLNAAGFRRVTSWDGTGTPTFSYGLAQIEDLDGYWIREDLISALSALWWSTHQVLGDGTAARTAWIQQNNCSMGYDAAIAWWAANGWGAPEAACMYRAAAEVSVYGGWQWTIVAGRAKGTSTLSGISTCRPCSAELYLMPIVIPFGVSPFQGGFAFNDIDGLGMSQDQLWLYETWAEATLASRTSAVLGDIAECPLVTAGVNCSNQAKIGLQVIWSYWVNKWNFTHRTP